MRKHINIKARDLYQDAKDFINIKSRDLFSEYKGLHQKQLIKSRMIKTL